MGRRSDFERLPKDKYFTWDKRAVAALLPHLMPETRFIEPCAGRGDLVDQLTAAGHLCIKAFDVEPQRADIMPRDALDPWMPRAFVDAFITNPPWDRKILHPMIEVLSNTYPTWLLFDSEWVNTKQAIPFLPRLRRIVSVGRMRWIEGTKMDAKESVSWYMFGTPGSVTSPADFYGRAA